MIGAQQDEREALIITQQHIVSRAISLDQLRLKQQRLGLTVGCHNRHRPRLRDHPAEAIGEAVNLRVIAHPVFECARLPDIEHIAARIMHPVNAGLNRQRLPNIADRSDPGVKIGQFRPAHGVRLLFLVKAIRGVRGGHRIASRYSSVEEETIDADQRQDHIGNRRH